MMSAALKRLDDEAAARPASVGVATRCSPPSAPEMERLLPRGTDQPVAVRVRSVQKQLEASASTNAVAAHHHSADHRDRPATRTTCCPGSAEATVNFRLLPGDTKEQIIERT